MEWLSKFGHVSQFNQINVWARLAALSNCRLSEADLRYSMPAAEARSIAHSTRSQSGYDYSANALQRYFSGRVGEIIVGDYALCRVVRSRGHFDNILLLFWARSMTVNIVALSISPAWKRG